MKAHALLLIAGLSPAALANEVQERDFPTLARVEYVLGCMQERGGENYDHLYGCVCAIDYIRAQFSYDEYNQATTFEQMLQTPGERSGVFRDPAQSERLRDKLAQVNEAAEKTCFLKN
jgi:hypothetical protein